LACAAAVPNQPKPPNKPTNDVAVEQYVELALAIGTVQSRSLGSAMGNCVQISSGGVGVGGSRSCAAAVEAGCQQPQRRRSTAGGDEEEAIIDQAMTPSSILKVKMVLTKGELGWLVAQLKAGDRRLADVLREMARKREGRAAADGWRPSLESIVECPAETAPAPDATSDKSD
jgi:hypothetical protein